MRYFHVLLLICNFVISFVFRKSWSGTGFYVNVKCKDKNDELLNAYCIMTNYHVFVEKEESGSQMVAMFHYDSSKKTPFKLLLEPFKLLASSEEEVWTIHKHFNVLLFFMIVWAAH